ncbi:MAG: HAD family hydrolase [Micrococcus sp.]|nr:HAD family hydrolase [Micrococcus sp.]
MPDAAHPAALTAVRRRPRLIATDLDGTVIGYAHTRSGRLSPRTIKALEAAHDAGIIVVFVTGRPLRWLDALRDQLGQVGPVICSNGAVVVDPASGQVLRAHGIDHPVLHSVVDTLRQADPDVSFGVEALEGFFWEADFRADDPPFEVSMSTRIEESFERAETVVKLMAKAPHWDTRDVLQLTRARVGDVVAVTHSVPGLALVEMSAPGVNKASTLERYAAEHGVEAADVVAFGDMPNDLEMLRWAGTGLAVGSGHELLRAAADGVVGACDDDGVAIAIEHLLTLPAA